ncbi:MAG TPA: hypothetical protein VN493_01485 [Thermoanaerobaculia bacterium]|nr:hypothetical protein [Thermoanaerobaculia bacterium]
MEQTYLGALGESTLTTWATARRILPQKVTYDQNGWDYLLEFPPLWGSTLPPYPRDREPARISCLVQVKATSIGDLNRSVSLTNWQRLITHPLPAFFLVIDFGEGVVPQVAYLVPVDAASIHQVLRRIRELDSQGEDIAKHTMSIVCKEEQRLEAPDGESLERAIRSHIGQSFEEYVRRKLETVETTGYESFRYQLTFEALAEVLQGVSPLEYLVDLSLGLREPLPINHAELRDVRFGIPARLPHRELSTGEIKIIPEPVERVEVVLSRGIHVVRTVMEMFLPRGLPVEEVLGAGLLKVLLKHELFRFTLRSSSMDVRFCDIESEGPKKLREFYDFARVVLLFEENANRKENLRIFVRSASRILWQGSLGFNEVIDPGIVDLAQTVLNAWEIAKHLDVQDEVELTVDILMSQEERFKILRSLLSTEIHQMKVGWFWERAQVSRSSTRVFVPFGVEVILGDFKGTVMFSVWGDVQCTGLEQEGMIQCEIATAEKRLERTFTSRRGEEGLSLSAAVKSIADAYDDVTCLILEHYKLPESS